jgi:hypothetical protein
MKKPIFSLLFVLAAFSISFAQYDPPTDSLQLDDDTLFYQSPLPITIEAESVVRFANTADVYLKWSAPPDVSAYTVSYKLGIENTNWTSVQRSTNELILENVPLDIELLWEVFVVGDTEPPKYQSDFGAVSTSTQREPIEVSSKLYSKLEGWFSKEENNEGFCEFFRSLDVHQYEKLAFLQAYSFENASFTKPTNPSSADLRDWYPSTAITGTGDGDECVRVPDLGGCNCRVVTSGANLAVPNGGYGNYKITPKINLTLAAHRYEAGAAKFISLKQNKGGAFGAGADDRSMSNLQGASDSSGVTTEASEIVFFLGCMKAGGFVTNLPASCLCERPLDIYYEYTTRLHVKAKTKSCVWSKGAEATAEDLAFVGVYEGKTGDITPLAAGQDMLSASCRSNWNPQFWIELLDVLTPLGQYYLQRLDTTQSRIPTTNQLTQFINGLQTLLNTSISNNSGSCETPQHDKVLVSGSATYTLRPNSPIRVGLFSSYYVRTRGYGCWEAQAGVASDYFLMGVVESQLESSECCAEKFANYVVGSLSSPPPTWPSWLGGPHFSLSAVNSIENRLQDVGFNLSIYGSWNGLDEDPGSGIILLEHEYDRLWGPSCIDDEFRGSAERSVEQSSNQHKVKVYPSVVGQHLNVEINADSPAFSQIRLLDLRGGVAQTFFSGELQEGFQSFQFPVDALAKGYYVVHCQVAEQNHIFKILIF